MSWAQTRRGMAGGRSRPTSHTYRCSDCGFSFMDYELDERGICGPCDHEVVRDVPVEWRKPEFVPQAEQFHEAIEAAFG